MGNINTQLVYVEACHKSKRECDLTPANSKLIIMTLSLLFLPVL